jgi:phage-related protein (TIGR01555 family)
MSRRNVKTPSKAFARTERPIPGADEPSYKDLARKAQGRDGLRNALAGMGTERDKRHYSHYSIFRPLTLIECENAYTASWLINKVVRVPAEDMTREWVDMSWNGSDKEMKFVTEAEQALNVRGKIYESLLWARLFGGCVIVIGIEGQDLTTPLDLDTITKGSLQYLYVLDRWRISWAGSLTDKPKDMGSENFGLPDTYIIAESAVRVHWSRVIRFDGALLPYFAFKRNSMWHNSELHPVLEAVKDYDGGKNAVAALLWEAVVDIIKAEGLAAKLTTEAGEEEVQNRYANAALSKSVFRTLLLDKETEEWEQKNVPFNQGMVDAVRHLMIDVCGAADIPTPRLFGQSPAGLTATGDSDIRNYYDHIGSKQESQMRRPMTKLYNVLLRHALGRWPENWKMEFRALWQMSDVDKSTIQLNRAKRDQLNIQSGIITEGVAAREAKEDQIYRTMEDSDVKMAEELSENLGEHEQNMRELQAAGAQKKLDEPAGGNDPGGDQP